MKIYNYNPNTKEFVGESVADEDRMRPGRFAIPAYATEVSPPAVGANEVSVFSAGAWTIAADHRGAVGYTDSGEEVVIENIGDTLESLGLLSEPPPPPPETFDQAKARLSAVVQSYLDTKPQERNYDGILSACSYATSTNPKFAAEGQACVAWRDDVWASCYQMLADVQAGTRAIPTEAELIAELPVLTWPEVS